MPGTSKTPQRPPQRRDRLIREREHDSYKIRSQLPDPTSCPECGALYRAGRWTWGTPPADTRHVVCPACQRIRDDYPGGYLRLGGSFLREHREELVALARHVEEREKADHPLKRIMAIAEEEGEILITTTDPRLARNIGDAVHHAYAGALDYQYAEEANVLRATWVR